jgi:hypothetical protein
MFVVLVLLEVILVGERLERLLLVVHQEQRGQVAQLTLQHQQEDSQVQTLLQLLLQ